MKNNFWVLDFTRLGIESKPATPEGRVNALFTPLSDRHYMCQIPAKQINFDAGRGHILRSSLTLFVIVIGHVLVESLN